MSLSDEEIGAGLGRLFGAADIDRPCAPALLAVIEGRATADERAAVEAHAEGCSWCRGALDEVDLEPLIPAQQRSRRGVLLAAVAFAAAAAVALFFALRPPPEPPGLVAKGGFRLHVAVERGGQPMRLGAGEALRPGDRFGLFYDVDRAGFVAAVYVDAQGQIVPLLAPPEGHRVEPATGGRLPVGAVVGPTDRCEHIVGLYSPDPLSAEQAGDIVGRMVDAIRDCQLGPVPADAGAVQADVRAVMP